MALFCKGKNAKGGENNPIVNCHRPQDIPGECATMLFPDHTYCDKWRHEIRFVPTKEGAEMMPGPSWLMAVGEAMFTAVSAAFDKAISTATGGIVDEWLTFEGSAEELLAGTIANGEQVAIDLAGSIGTNIAGMVSDVTNQSAKAMGEFLGVAKAQERVATEVESAVAYLLEQGEWEADTHRREAREEIEAVEAAATEAVRLSVFLETEAVKLFEQSAVDLSNLETIDVTKQADKLLGFSFDAFEVNRSIMYDLAFQHGVNLDSSFASGADVQLSTINDIFLEGVIKPQAMAESYYQAMKQASNLTSEEYEQSLIQQALVSAQMAADMLHSELDPLDWLTSRLKAD